MQFSCHVNVKFNLPFKRVNTHLLSIPILCQALCMPVFLSLSNCLQLNLALPC